MQLAVKLLQSNYGLDRKQLQNQYKQHLCDYNDQDQFNDAFFALKTQDTILYGRDGTGKGELYTILD